MAKYQQTAGQGFIIKLDDCKRLVTGVQIKNLRKNYNGWRTKKFRVSGSLGESGPWNTLVEEELVDVDGPAPLLEFVFDKPEEVQFLKFDLLSFWGDGGALQYFAAVSAEGECKSKYENTQIILCALRARHKYPDGYISETKRAIRDPLVSKRPEIILSMKRKLNFKKIQQI